MCGILVNIRFIYFCLLKATEFKTRAACVIRCIYSIATILLNVFLNIPFMCAILVKFCGRNQGQKRKRKKRKLLP